MSPAPRAPYLPLSRRLLAGRLRQEYPAAEQADFDTFVKLLAAHYHHHFHALRERLKELFARLERGSPEAAEAATAEQREQAAHELGRALDRLLTRANYTRVTFEEIHEAMRRTPVFQIGLKVELDDFDELVVYRRGEVPHTETVRSWFGLRRRQVSVTAYDRVCLYVRFKEAEHFAGRRRPLGLAPGAVCLKLFHNIPQQDLEMLLPSCEVKMRLRDRLVIGGTVAGYALYTMLFKLSGAALLAVVLALGYKLGLRQEEPNWDLAITACVSLGVFGGVLWRQWNRFRSKKIYFLQVLSQNLYYRNLDNGPGVFHHLLDSAEEAEVKEALLAYTFLRQARTEEELDAAVEQWLEPHCGAVNFDHEDALRKLEELELVRAGADGRREARSLPEVIRSLDERWDRLFEPAAPSSPTPPEQEIVS